MNRKIQLIMALIFVLFVSVGMAQRPQIVFDDLEQELGTFKESDGIQTATFRFTNKGSEPLVLNNVRTSCGCASSKWSREPVAPEGRGEIEVSYDPANRPGTFSETLIVSSNAQNSAAVLKITGSVEEREKTLAELYPRQIGSLRAKTNHMSFARMTNSEVKTEEMELVNDTDNPIVVGFRTVPDHLSATVEPQTIPPNGKGKLTITFNSKEANAFGFSSHRIYLSLDGSNDYRSSISVSATIEEDFSDLSSQQLANAPVASFSETSFDLGEMKQGEKKEHTFILKNDGKTELIIRNIRASCGCTAVSPPQNAISPGETTPIKVTFDSRGKRGRTTNSITVITNDPKVPTSILRITGNVITDS